VRAVLDTNVLISAYVFPGGAPEAVYRLAIEGRLEIGTSRPLLGEFARVLRDKFGWTSDRVAVAIAQLTRIAVVVEPVEEVHVVTADPSDDRVLEAAAAFGADVIVSGDRHLRDLQRWRGIEIVSSPELLVRHLA
jgi:putative PIN family toxin of toxin-antitoxin system